MYVSCCNVNTRYYRQAGRGERSMVCLLHYSPKFYNMILNFWINNFVEIVWIVIGWFFKLSVQTFQPLFVIYRWDNFVYHHWYLHKFIGHCLIPLDPWQTIHTILSQSFFFHTTDNSWGVESNFITSSGLAPCRREGSNLRLTHNLRR